MTTIALLMALQMYCGAPFSPEMRTPNLIFASTLK